MVIIVLLVLALFVIADAAARPFSSTSRAPATNWPKTSATAITCGR